MKRTLKTAQMYELENRLGKPIEELLVSGTGKEVAKKLGLNEATVSRWKERLHIDRSLLPEMPERAYPQEV